MAMKSLLGLNGLLVLALVSFSTVASYAGKSDADSSTASDDGKNDSIPIGTGIAIIEVWTKKSIHVTNDRTHNRTQWLSSNPCTRTHRYIYRV